MNLLDRLMPSGPSSMRITWPRVAAVPIRQVEMAPGQTGELMMTASGCVGRSSAVRTAVVIVERDDKQHHGLPFGVTMEIRRFTVSDDSQAIVIAGLNSQPYAPPNRPQATQLRARALLNRGGRCALRWAWPVHPI